MQPIADTDRAIVFRTVAGLLTVPRIKTAGRLHSINSAINRVLTEVVKFHDTVAATAPSSRETLRPALNGARADVVNLTSDIQTMRKQGAPADAIRCAEVAQREMLGNLEKLQASLKLWPE
jgi:hypothetical protein